MPDHPFTLFRPILAGATLRARLIGCVGSLLAIGLTGVVTALVTGGWQGVPLIVAPMGASAVLLFAVPASPLAQPWPVIGGNLISALVGVVTAQLVPDMATAAALAVALAILAMSLTRTLHPPGGAAALTAVVGGKAVAAAGLLFPLVPVGVNAALMVAVALLFHRLTGTAYPHRPAAPAPAPHGTADQPPAERVGFTTDDVDRALAAMGETFDIDRDDLALLLDSIERQALSRKAGAPRCADIMSRDVVTIGIGADVAEALAALLSHNIRTLPVLDESRNLAGTIGLRELAGLDAGPIRPHLGPATLVSPDLPAADLLPTLTDGRHHVVIVADADGNILGVVSQTDLLATLYRAAAR